MAKPSCFGQGRVLRTQEVARASLPSDFFLHRMLTGSPPGPPPPPLPCYPVFFSVHVLEGAAMDVSSSCSNPPPQPADWVWWRADIAFALCGLHAEGVEGGELTPAPSVVALAHQLPLCGGELTSTLGSSSMSSPVKMEMQSTTAFNETPTIVFT